MKTIHLRNRLGFALAFGAVTFGSVSCGAPGLQHGLQAASVAVLHPFVDVEVPGNVQFFSAVNIPFSMVEGERTGTGTPCIWLYPDSADFPFQCLTSHPVGNGLTAYIRHGEHVDWLVYPDGNRLLRIPVPPTLNAHTQFREPRRGCIDVETPLVPGGELTIGSTLCLPSSDGDEVTTYWFMRSRGSTAINMDRGTMGGRTVVSHEEHTVHAEFWNGSDELVASHTRTYTSDDRIAVDVQAQEVGAGQMSVHQTTFAADFELGWWQSRDGKPDIHFTVEFRDGHMWILGPSGTHSPFITGGGRTERMLGLFDGW